jgi:hypothetical protein
MLLMRDSKPLITTGERGVYSWIEWNYQADFLSNLLRSFPELVVGRYLINTSFDSGPLPRSDDEIANGWDELNGSTLSPLISTADEIPTCGYDEWYVFQQPSRLECFEVFVNYGGFPFTRRITKKRQIASGHRSENSNLKPIYRKEAF